MAEASILPFAELPTELLAESLALLSRFRDLLACACVSKHWSAASGALLIAIRWVTAGSVRSDFVPFYSMIRKPICLEVRIDAKVAAP